MLQNILQFFKGILFFIYLILVFYITLNNEYLTTLYQLPRLLIPAISILSIIFIGYKFVVLFLNVNKLEREFTSIVNHSFRTPITGSMWFLKELEKEMPEKDRLLYIQNIKNTMDKILSIVDIFAGIKNINNTAGYTFEATSLREIVEKSIAMQREEINRKKLIFKVSTFKDIPLLTIDLKKISFVIDTVLENAVFYTPKEGKILVDCLAEKEKLTFYISDTGIGLSLIDKLRIFSRFYRGTNAKLIYPNGMGLRLYLSKIIIKRHFGKIYAKSKGKNTGTTIFIELPFKKGN